MEPITVTIAALLGLASIAAIALWKNILDWCENSLYPWLEEYLPSVVPYVREAFRFIDKYIATPIYSSIKNSWRELRKYLLQSLAEFIKKHNGEWERKLTSYIAVSDDNIVKQEVIEKVSWEELPSDVREEFIRKGKSEYSMDITKMRDKEMEVELL